MQDLTTDNELMEQIAKYLAPHIQEANEQFKDTCKIKMITFIPIHESMIDCRECTDKPIACLRCIVTLFPKDDDAPIDA